MYQIWRATQRIAMKRVTLTMGFHRGHFQLLPPTYTFPRMPYKQLIDIWYVRIKRQKIPPLEILSALHVAHLGTPGNWNSGKVKLRQMRCVMATLEKYAKREKLYLSNKGLWTSENTKRMWGNIGEKYLISKMADRTGMPRCLVKHCTTKIKGVYPGIY